MNSADGYREIALATAGPHVGTLVERIRDLAPGGFSIEEPYVPLGPEEGARLEPWRPTVVKLYLPADDRQETLHRRLQAAIAALPFSVEVMERHVRAEDWAESWKAFFDVEHVGARIVIRPSWREYLPRPDDVVLDLDPGMAFGTGQHPTTRLCLAALEGFLRPGMAVLDLGCGSGILSVAAVKLGCSQVWALDIEQVAVEATLANIARNAAAPQVHCALGSLGEPWPFADPARGIADLAVANISAAVLVNLAVPIVEALRPDGVLIGSGIIAERLDEVLVAFAAAGLSSQDIHADGDWRAVIARRPA